MNVFTRISFPALFILLFLNARGQLFTVPQYPQNYFQWPIGATKALSANFGELRSNHFHMGLDCKSDRAENKDIYAAAAGYVAKVKIEPWGFGRAIYINHPNGLTSLYAHLNDFYPALEDFIKEQQYKQKSWRIFLEDIPPNLFPVSQGMFIAKSGNTGGSMGPHLHFEIRDTKTDKVLNPLLFGFEVIDNQPPDLLRLALYDRSRPVYDQSPKIFPLKKVNGVYVPASGSLTVNTEKISFAVTAWDRYTGSTNQNGIFAATLYVNDKPVSGFQLNAIDYIETRDLNGHVDYRTRFFNGPWLQHLSKLPGMNADFYKADASEGVVSLQGGETKFIRIDVSDANGNISKLAFTVQAANIINPAPPPGSRLFKWDEVNVFENEHVNFYLATDQLYDDFHFQYKETPSATGRTVYGLHNPGVPVKKYFSLKIKDNPIFKPTDKMVMKRIYNNKEDYKKANYENGWYRAEFRELGFFQLVEDLIPPTISSNGFVSGMNASRLGRIVFTVNENTDELESFVAKLDGNWLRFTNDKGKNFIYKFDEKCPPGPHTLEVTATDIAGNFTIKTFEFTR